ncbi:hypothetical protein [Nonomuraea sp. CA-141351]|uniref:hypothetical protein n=1 Tax=Nonomuraea sp. CA-141351 TaxID=3239996 RepID=UPI003D8FEE2C
MVALLRPKWAPFALGALIVGMAAAATACRSRDASSGASPATTNTASPAAQGKAAVPEEQAVATAYRNLYVSGQQAERTSPERRRPLLANVATQPLLDRMVRGIAALQATGRVTWGNPVLHTFDVKVNGDKASLHDCQDATETGQADAKTGERLTHGTTDTHLVVTFRKGEDGAWRASTLEQVDGPCSPTD